MGLSYKEHLFNKKWKQKKERILSRDNHRCQICGSTVGLVVHHKQYHVTPTGEKYLPWMYDDRFLVTLCERCHNKGHREYIVPTKVIPHTKSLFM